ncbi:unnamed protein product [Paramecium primaurelia]|uniref:Uncharacterized protein n=2 Tax=Paramecium TaxID=5884 RepID=A0A8S1TSW8_9CILI|nr:unnamed protein product [Paramecium primaurelia]CAD8154046.1 unnamed protein product [Paramecium pentaurelia]
MSKTGLIIDEQQQFSSESSERKVSTRKNRPIYTQTISVKRYHKIPLRTQQILFEQVFKNGKKIKQAAKELKMNYSSAKSLIHYYKTEKRPVPDQVKKLIGQKKQASFCQIEQKNIDGAKLFVEIQVNHQIINSYNYFQKLHNEVKEETI